MRNLFHLFSICVVGLALMACQPMDSHPKEMTGSFIVNFNLNDGAFNKEEVKQQIDNAIQEMRKDLGESKEQLMKDMDVSQIDTTTTSGKLEYYFKQLAKPILELGENIAEMAGGTSEIVSELGAGGTKVLSDILGSGKFDVDLNEDGTIKMESILFKEADNMTWVVQGDNFIVKDEDGTERFNYNIVSKSKEGFVLEKDKIQVTFTRKLGQ